MGFIGYDMKLEWYIAFTDSLWNDFCVCSSTLLYLRLGHFPLIIHSSESCIWLMEGQNTWITLDESSSSIMVFMSFAYCTGQPLYMQFMGIGLICIWYRPFMNTPESQSLLGILIQYYIKYIYLVYANYCSFYFVIIC